MMMNQVMRKRKLKPRKQKLKRLKHLKSKLLKLKNQKIIKTLQLKTNELYIIFNNKIIKLFYKIIYILQL